MKRVIGGQLFEEETTPKAITIARLSGLEVGWIFQLIMRIVVLHQIDVRSSNSQQEPVMTGV